MIGPEHERRQPPGRRGFGDAVTFSWADRERELFGVARLGVADGGASALSVLVRGREPVGVLAEGGIELAPGADWADLAAAGLRTTVASPLETWTVAREGGDHGYELTFTAASPPGPLAALEGTEGYEQLCRVAGTVRIGDERIEVAGLGQRGHVWGVADWDRLALTRTLSVWLPGEQAAGVALVAARPAGAPSHAAETVQALLVEDGEPVEVADPRLSTTYDGDGRPRRVGLELWVTEDGYPHRAAGEVLCGTSLELGALSLDVAFLRWHLEGREGVGRYEILRRA